MTRDELDALSPDEVGARLAGPDRPAFIRATARAGQADAQAVYGQMLLDGWEVPRDEAAAFGWFRRAAAQQHLMALNMVGRCYDLGQGTAVDKARAAACFRVAAERGLPEAMYNYATSLTLGEGVAEDRPAALAWLERAAGLGFAKALNFVGQFHEDGWVVERDMVRAADCYARAAEGGDFRAMFNQARLLASAGERDGALAWLRRAGADGNTRFVEKAATWLAASTLGADGVAALREGARRC